MQPKQLGEFLGEVIVQLENGGLHSMVGKYQRDGILWQNEHLNKVTTKYVRENTAVKGRPNLTAGSFCQWANECLLNTHNPGTWLPTTHQC